ncbi:MAG: C4-type zinc ribbon domain-containing protein [Candidatus Omnitrophica bacterium]|nr:C4-type zinc ribbon domain-containing protein [Candidatus Omnitrophota bacterium]
MDIKEEIRKLIQLQELDSHIYSLTNRKDVEIPIEIDRLKKSLEGKGFTLTTFEEKVKKLYAERKDKELDLATKEENIRKAQSQLYQLKTNKEYKAKLLEIESLKADVSKIEDSVIRFLEELDRADKELKEIKNKFSEEEKLFKEKESKLIEEQKKLEIEIKSLQEKKAKLSCDVNKDVLAVYEKLIRTRGGIAIVPVEDENCGACHIRVTAQKINEIKMYKELVFCEACVRILWIKGDFE